MKGRLLIVALALLTATTLPAKVKVTTTPLGEHPQKSERQRVKVSTEDFIVDENFEAITAGSVEAPDFGNHLEDDSQMLDPDLFHGKEMHGYKVYPAGGAIALQTYDPMDKARIETSRSDFSGSVKVEFLAKYMITEWKDENGKKWHFSGSSIGADLTSDSDRQFDIDGYNGYYLCNVRLYEADGWTKITLEFDNFSAYNDAYLVLYTDATVLIDDLKVTSSVDNFIAAPIISGVSNVTDTSFTVNFEPVTKSYNYYTYLYKLAGTDPETGEPIYQAQLDPETIEELESKGMSVDEYFEGIPDDYHNFGIVEPNKPTSFTYTGLDPNEQYYYAVRAHYVTTFSDKYEIYPMKEMAVPTANIATDITGNSFKASWSKVTKADSYVVNLYGVNQVLEDEEAYIIFEEDFGKTGGYTDATDIHAPEPLSSESGISLDDLTSTPGWSTNIDHALVVDGMLGVDKLNYWLKSPMIYMAGADVINVTLRALCPEDPDFTFYIKFNGKTYQVSANGGVFEDTIVIPTEGLKEGSIWFKSGDYMSLFLDYISIAQPLKKGDRTFTWLGSQDATDTNHVFTDLNPDLYDMYAFSVKSVRGEDPDQITSAESDRIIVDLKNKHSESKIEEISVDGKVVEVARFTIDGRKIRGPQPGVNIIRYSDGSTRRVLVK